jgi:Gene Transfer Agent (GTA)-like protein/putative tail protein
MRPHYNREDVCAAALDWLGTPYKHQASLKGIGTDCLGLIRGVYHELEGQEPEVPPPYTADWAEIGVEGGACNEEMAIAARRHLVEGPRLADLNVQGSTEGAAIPRVFGRVRLSGQLIWATNFKETATTSSSGGGKGSSGNSVETTTYSYAVSFAVALCEGPITRIGSIWADGNLLDLSQIVYRVHEGEENQAPDGTIEAVEGAGNAPAYRGVSYIVFDDLPLAAFGNRLPQLTFEVFRTLGDVEQNIRAVTLIPGATEFGYDTVAFRRVYADGVSHSENINNQIGMTDWTVSLDDLQATCPNCSSVALVSTWYGDDLRAGECTLRPKVDTADKVSIPEGWQVAGLQRTEATTVSTVEGRPAFGGTPSDRSVKRAIENLRDRGLSVMFYPFVMMDIPAGNGLRDPYGATEQAAYPWRGRISVEPAPGFVGSPDKTTAVTEAVAGFFGTASASDFSISASGITYSGPDEWSYRRMVLHNAALCVWAGGVDGFLIGSELRGLTQLRDGEDNFPTVAQLILLLEEVRVLLGGTTKISYAADWSEYFGHHPQDGSSDVYFHLDPLWAHSDVDFVGIDNYMPLADWRDGYGHADKSASVDSPYELDYLKGNIAGGEGFDWYYASESDRSDQIRTPITDGAHNKPWVFRYKDLYNWWRRPHYNRPGGVEASTSTAWQPESKPFWFTEIGCPAIDKGANQPNVFVDPKSSESVEPYFSNGLRDDYAQRRFLEAHLGYWRPGAPGFSGTSNPISSLTGERMVDADRLFVWTWDARPFPSFPNLTSVWADGENWKRGHWITGRLGSVPLSLLVKEISSCVGDVPIDASGLTGTVDGFLIDRIMSPRQALEPLMLAYFFDAAETEGQVRFRHQGGEPAIELCAADLAVADNQESAGFLLVRGQETELPFSAKLTYVDPDIGYRQAAVEARRQTVQSDRVSSAALPIVMGQQNAQQIADIWLQDTWVKRERATLLLPPSKVALDPGDTVTLKLSDRKAVYQISGLHDGGVIEAEAVRTEARVFGLLAAPEREASSVVVSTYGAPDVAFLDLPLLSGEEVPHAPHIAATSTPWPDGIVVFKSATGTGFKLDQVIDNPATMGRTLTGLAAGPASRWDRVNTVQVRIGTGELQSVDELALLSGANVAALENELGDWEVFQFATATLIDVNTYELSVLLRGQKGTEEAVLPLLPAGARFVLLNSDLEQLNQSLEDRGRSFHWRFGPRNYALDHESYVTTERSFDGVGARPLSPVHVKARRLATGDIALTWIRRTRIGGDSWDGVDVPLGEEMEAYEIDIMDGSSVKRTISASATNATYLASDQSADFGSTTFPNIALRTFQLSQTFGRGAVNSTIIDL